MNDLAEKSSEIRFGSEERGYVYAVARRILRTEQDAEDVTQEALLLAYRHRAAFRGDARYRTWLHRIAWTTALGHLRKQRRSRECLELPLVEPPSPERSPEDEVASRETTARVEHAIAALEPKYREVVALRADELSEQEIARQLGLTIPNVKIRMHRARGKLRRDLALSR